MSAIQENKSWYEPTENSLCIFSKQKKLFSWRMSLLKGQQIQTKKKRLVTEKTNQGTLWGFEKVGNESDHQNIRYSTEASLPQWYFPVLDTAKTFTSLVTHNYTTLNFYVAPRRKHAPSLSSAEWEGCSKDANTSGGGSMWPYKCMGKNTKNSFTELVLSNLSVCKPVLKSTTSLIAMLGIGKVCRPRWSSSGRFPGEAPVPGHSLQGGPLSSRQSAHTMSK